MTPHYKDCEIFIQRTCKFLRIYSVYMYVCMYVCMCRYTVMVVVFPCGHVHITRVYKELIISS